MSLIVAPLEDVISLRSGAGGGGGVGGGAVIGAMALEMSGNVQEVSLQMGVIKGGVRGEEEVPAPAPGSRVSSTAEPV